MFIVGRAIKDAEAFSTKKGKSFSKVTVAVNEYKGKDSDEKSFFYDILIFGKSAEVALEKVKKGDILLVYGKPDFDAYISKKDNEPKTSVSVLADSWNVLK